MFKKLLFTLLFLPTLLLAQHTIKGTFSPAEDYKWAILYRVEPSNMFYAANTQVDEEGKFSLDLDSTIVKGVYRLVYALPQEDFNFDIIYNGEEDIELEFNTEKGVTFVASEENKLLAAYEASMIEIQEQVSNSYKAEPADPKLVSLGFKNLEMVQNQFETDGKGYMAANFIKANRPYIAKTDEDFQTFVKNYKASYFTNVDFNNPVLQKSGFLLQRCLNYIQGFVSNSEENVNPFNENVDVVAAVISTSEASFQKALLENLWQELVNDQEVNTANHLAEKYLIPIANNLGDKELSEKLTLFKNLSIGSKAPDFSWEEDVDGKTKNNSLYNINEAQNYIIAFWSSGCSHCLKEIPLLHQKVKGLEVDEYKVIAIGLEDEPYDWRNKITDFPEFINVLGLGKWENEIGDKYDVISTPTYFVLDKNKNITAKPEELKDLLKFIDPSQSE